MSIPLTCPNGHFLKVKNSWAGKKGLCPHCGAIIQVPPLSAGSASVMGRSGSSVITEIPGRKPVDSRGIAANEETIEKQAADTSPLVARQKPTETKPVEPKPVETKPAETKSVEAALKSSVMRLVTAKPLETKLVVAKPIEPTHPPKDEESVDSSKSVLDSDSIDEDGSSIFNDLAPKKGSTPSQSRMFTKSATAHQSGNIKPPTAQQAGIAKLTTGSQSAIIKPPTKVAPAQPSTITARKFCPACKVNVLTLTGVCPRCQLKIPVIPELHRVH